MRFDKERKAIRIKSHRIRREQRSEKLLWTKEAMMMLLLHCSNSQWHSRWRKEAEKKSKDIFELCQSWESGQATDIGHDSHLRKLAIEWSARRCGGPIIIIRRRRDSNLFLNKVLRPTKDFDPFNRLYPIGMTKLIIIYGPVVFGDTPINQDILCSGFEWEQWLRIIQLF